MVLFNVLHSVFLKVVSSLSSQYAIYFPFFLSIHEGKKGRHKAKHVALKNILYSAIMTPWVQLTFGKENLTSLFSLRVVKIKYIINFNSKNYIIFSNIY